MKTLSIRKWVILATVSMTCSLFFFSGGLLLESTIHGSWNSVCTIENSSCNGELIQVQDTFFCVDTFVCADSYESIRLFASSDGCTWSEIASPVANRELWVPSMALFKTSDDRLGIAWKETNPDKDAKPSDTFFVSTFDGTTWREPQLLFQRDEYCYLESAIMLEDGALLLLWSEKLVMTATYKGKAIKGSGCDVVYRAYVKDGEVLAERVIEPEDPYLCFTEPCALVDDGNRIWCIFEYEHRHSFYRSWSEDGRKWSPPEHFSARDPIIERFFLTPQGEIGTLDFEHDGNELFLLTSRNWEDWSREKIFTTKDAIRSVIETTGKKGMACLVSVEGDNPILIQPSQASAAEEHKKAQMVTALKYLSSICVVLAVIGGVLSVWKHRKPIDAI